MIEALMIGAAVVVGLLAVTLVAEVSYMVVMLRRLFRGDFGDPTDLTE